MLIEDLEKDSTRSDQAVEDADNDAALGQWQHDVDMERTWLAKSAATVSVRPVTEFEGLTAAAGLPYLEIKLP